MKALCLIAALLGTQLMAQVDKPLGPNRRVYPFDAEMHKRIYDAPGFDSAWTWIPRSLMIATYGDIIGVELYHDSLVITRRNGAKWADIDKAVRRIVPPPTTSAEETGHAMIHCIVEPRYASEREAQEAATDGRRAIRCPACRGFHLEPAKRGKRATAKQASIRSAREKRSTG